MRKLANKELGRLTNDDYKSAPKQPIVLVLDNIRSALNVGSAFRTSDCFRIEKIVICGFTAQPPHKDILKSALGASESVDWEYYEEITDGLTALKQEGYQVLAIEQADKSVMLNDFEIDTKSKYALVFGNEVRGVSKEAMELSDNCIEIPQWGTKHSFNVSVSIGIVLWSFVSRFSAS